MPVTAAIKFTQGITTDLAGRALIGTATGVAVNMTNGNNADAFNWTYEMITAPTASAVPLGVISTGAIPSASFTPDVVGGYLVRLTVSDAVGNQAQDVRAFILKENSLRIIPPFRADSVSFNYGGQTEGWDPALEQWLKAIDGRAPVNDNSTGMTNNISTIDGAYNTVADGLRFTNAVGPTITGFGQGYPGRRLYVMAAAAALTLNNQDAGSLAENRIVTGTGAAVTLSLGQSAWLIYDGVDLRWRMQPLGTGAGGTAAVVFNDAVPADKANLSTTRVFVRAIDNTKAGATSLGSDSTALLAANNGNYATQGGGDRNTTSGNYSTVAGGLLNQANGDHSFVGGGQGNVVSDAKSAIVGGASCSIAAGQDFNFIGAGDTCQIGAGRGWDVIGGGFHNQIQAGVGIESVIGGGESNIIDGASIYATIAGGKDNNISSGQDGSTIGGGRGNNIDGAAAASCTISGGFQNEISGRNSGTIAGGQGNILAADFGFAAGLNNQVSDSTNNSSSFAIGNGNSVTARNAGALGYLANAIRSGQFAFAGTTFSSSVGEAQVSWYSVAGTSANAAATVLMDLAGNQLNLENGKAYAIKATCISNRVAAAGRAMFIHTLLVHCSAGTAVIDNDNTTLSVLNGTTYAIVFSASGANIVATFTGTAGQTVQAMVTYEIHELAGGP